MDRLLIAVRTDVTRRSLLVADADLSRVAQVIGMHLDEASISSA